jgi:hypothetical protein
MGLMLRSLETFILSGATVSGISYVGNQMNPLAAGIISGIPISIPSMLLINGRKNREQFIFSAFVMVSWLAVITGLCSFLFAYIKLSADVSVGICFVSWCIGGYIYYLYISKKSNKL